jgi:hypothetical protein
MHTPIQRCLHTYINIHITTYILSCVLVTIDGVGVVIELTDHLQIITTSNYSAIASYHTLQFTTSRTKSSQSAVSLVVVAW